jgi:DEAD/DEAH box helicase domain-containing protein
LSSPGSTTLLHELRQDDSLAGQIAHVQELPPRAASYADVKCPIHLRLQEQLEKLGLEHLFSHQAQAYDAVSGGDDVAVVTGTNSGKTLCYNLPVIQRCLTEPAARALYLFPTKALAQDQLGKLNELIPGADVRCGTYDGDTPPSQRAPLRRIGNIILSNPDMLHVAILPGHEKWTRFLKSLRVLVLDEMHVYRGVFGSHVGCIIHRLLRLCEWHHNRPQIIACSATIGNPGELFQKLTGRKCRVIAEDGSPKARRTFVFWNPPKIDELNRMSANVITSEVIANLCESKLRTLGFCRARVTTELVLRYTRDRLEKGGQIPPERVESYRAGYTIKERRQIEKALFKGDLLALIATNAMELGVDIGGLDAVVMNGYPGTISSFWQQAGRAGRGTREGLAIMVAHDDPMEQFLIREPHRIMEAGNDSVAANPQNPQILAQQLKCAAHERALAPSELEEFGANAIEIAEGLDRSGELQFQAGRFFYPAFDPPANKVNIRGSSGDEVTLLLDGEELGTMERWRAMQSAHEGAVYLHGGVSFIVQHLDLGANRAHVTQQQVPFYTQAMVQSVLEPQVDIGLKSWGRHDARLEGLKVTDLVIGYKQIALEGQHVIAINDLQMPPVSFETLGIRLDLPAIGGEEDLMERMGGLHALEHLLMAVAPLVAGCDRGDLGSAWYSAFPDTQRPTLFVFDRTPGGVGLAEQLFKHLKPWASAGLQLVNSCSCEEGCPGCILSARCEANNDVLSKSEALSLLRDLSA